MLYVSVSLGMLNWGKYQNLQSSVIQIWEAMAGKLCVGLSVALLLLNSPGEGERDHLILKFCCSENEEGALSGSQDT